MPTSAVSSTEKTANCVRSIRPPQPLAVDVQDPGPLARPGPSYAKSNVIVALPGVRASAAAMVGPLQAEVVVS